MVFGYNRLTINIKSQIICSLCGKTINKELQNETIREIIDGTSYTFDTNDCMLMFKKFGSVYESNLFSE